MKNTVLLHFCAIAAVVAPHAQGQSPLNTNPSRVVGQPFLISRSTNPNVAEGREFQGPFGVAIDTSSTPFAVYVADTGNNRVLGWKNSALFTNGQPADIILGQLDKYSTGSLGPGTNRSTGMSSPIAVAVDSKGNLYVADGGNNRILRYPKPTAGTDDFQTPDMVIGQTTFTNSGANNGGLSEKTIALHSNGQLARSAMAFDQQGNMYFSDTLNNRVLRYPAAALNAGGNAPPADMVIGQISFTINTAPPASAESRLSKSVLFQPSGLALDPTGRLYVCDSLARCLVYPTVGNGATAARIMGLPAVSSQTNPNQVTEYTLASPEGIFMIGNNPIVCDSAYNRLLRYDAYENWAPETPTPAPANTPVILSPPAKGVIGQSSFGGSKPNRSLGEPNEFTLNNPVAGAMAGTDMLVADGGNNRVLVFPSQATSAAASRVLGQDGFAYNSVNLTEGKEMFLYAGVSRDQNFTGDESDGGGVVVDFKSSTPHLYVADTFNNRILGYRDARRVRPGDKADIVIGQADFGRTIPNAPAGNRDLPQDIGLYRPSSLAVDANGALWVCDSANGRVLRYASPFDQSGRIRPNLVIGQTGLFAKVTDPTRVNLAYPAGVAFTGDGHLLVSDAAQNRVLFFRKPAGGDFTNGQPAEKVIGQADFNTGTRSSALNRLLTPRQIAVDTDDRLYVTDSGNSRIVIYDRIVAPGNDPQFATTIPSLNVPQGLYVSTLTGEIWVADTRNNRAVRFPKFDRLALNPTADYAISSVAPLALTQDAFGNLYIAEGINRVAIFFNGLATTNAANFNDVRIAPGMIASVFPRAPNVPFGDQTAGLTALPMPTTLGDIQVLIDDKPVPLYYVSPGQINFLVPMSIATSGTAEFQVVKPSIGQVLASGRATLDRVAPALFAANGSGNGQLAAINADDNTPNSPTNPVGRSKIITLYGTGGGFVTGAPPDGVAPAGAISTDAVPDVLIGTEFVPVANISYSGLAPGFPGLWQINVKIPDSVVPSAQVPVVVRVFSITSNNGKTGQPLLRTTIAVKQ